MPFPVHVGVPVFMYRTGDCIPQVRRLRASPWDPLHLVAALADLCPSLKTLHIHAPQADDLQALLGALPEALCASSSSSHRGGSSSGGEQFGGLQVCLPHLRSLHAPDWLALQPQVLAACSGGLEQLGVRCGPYLGVTQGFMAALRKGLQLLPALHLLRLQRLGHTVRYSQDLLGPGTQL